MSGTPNLYPELQLFIDGEWISKGDRKSELVLNPATGEVLGELPHATTADLDRALASSQKGFKAWSSMLPEKRGEILRKAADLLKQRGDQVTKVASMESGKVIAQSRIELHMATEVLEWYAEEGRRTYGRVLTQRQAQPDQGAAGASGWVGSGASSSSSLGTTSSTRPTSIAWTWLN